MSYPFTGASKSTRPLKEAAVRGQKGKNDEERSKLQTSDSYELSFVTFFFSFDPKLPQRDVE